MEPPQSIPKKPYFCSISGRARAFVRGAALAVAASGCSEEVREAQAEAGSSPPATLVRVATVRAGDLETELRVPAEVEAVARSTLASGADGAVERVEAEVGDRVSAGQALVRVDDRLPRARAAVARAELERARAESELAAKERDRIEQLKPGVVSDLERDRARAEAAAARARVAAAEATVAERAADLAQFVVKAPYDGYVAARRVDPGTWVRPGQPVMDVVSAQQIELIVDGSRVLAGRIAPGDAATIHAPRGALKGRVTGVVPALDPVSRTLRIRVVPADDADVYGLVAGDAVEVGFSVSLAEEGVLVTTDALLETPDETRIFEVDEGVAALRTVEVLGRSGASALVRGEGLEPGDRVVVRGNERLRPGQSVRVEGDPLDAEDPRED